jgi:hypothetical protein
MDRRLDRSHTYLGLACVLSSQQTDVLTIFFEVFKKCLRSVHVALEHSDCH